MSIFSSIRRSRQQAKEHKSKVADQKKKEEEEGGKEPYRHVPTHAAADAFASAPPSWRETADRPRIIEENRRRSAMAAAAGGHHHAMNLPSVPRIGSSLSYMSYPGPLGGGRGSSASSVVVGGGVGGSRMRLPRTYSTGGISPYPDGSRDIIYSIPDVSHPDDYPTSQNTGSSSSQDDLEMPRVVSRPPLVTGGGRPHIAAAPVVTAAAAAPPSKVHRLHPSNRSRRTSDASVVDRPAPPAVPAAAASITAAVPTSPVRQDSWLPMHKPRVSSLQYAGSRTSDNVAPRPLDADAIVPNSPTTSRSTAHADTLRALEAPAPSRPPRFTGVEPTSSSNSSSANSSSSSSSSSRREDVHRTKGQEPAAPVPQPIINMLPEPASGPRDPSPPAKAKSKRLTKGGGRLLKKNR